MIVLAGCDLEMLDDELPEDDEAFASSAPGYVGCFTDDLQRALPVLLGTGHTNHSCRQAALAAGYRYAGTQAAGYCFAGNAVGYTQVPDWECNTPCTANPAEMCGGPWRNSIHSSATSGGSSGAPIPPPPADTRDRFGIYNWNVDAAAFAPTAGCADRLNWGACLVAGLGSRTIRVFLGSGSDIYQLYGGIPPATLRDVARSAPYAALFAKPFSTYLLTVYTAADQLNPWYAGYGDEALRQAEAAEIADLTEYLAVTYPGKTFILLNWEGDNAVRQFNTDPAWDGFARWIQTRADGVAAGRARLPFAARVYSGLEFNLARRVDNPTQPCGSDPASTLYRCVVSYVGPRVSVDYYSYSSWQSNNAPVDNRLLENWEVGPQLVGDLDAIERALGAVGRHRIIVGEFGHARGYFAAEGPLGCGAAKRTAASANAIAGWGAAYGIFWQIVDNAASGGVDDFGIYDRLAQPTATRDLMSNLYSFQSAAVPGYCPP